jgi:hypothetical protein
MESMREAWTDERLDDLKGEVRLLRGGVGSLRTEMNARFDSMQRTMIYCFVSLSTMMLAGFVGVATQL